MSASINKTFLILLFSILLNGNLTAQVNYSGINVQGQLNGIYQDETNITLKVIVLSLTNDTLWLEQHNNILLSTQKSFNLTLGKGDYISGTILSFNAFNWYNAATIKLFYISPLSEYEIGSYNIFSFPFAMHSLTSESTPFLIDLTDSPSTSYPNLSVLKFDGSTFYYGTDIKGDSTHFSYYNNTSLIADTAEYALNNFFADSSVISFYSDTSLFSFITNHSIFSDSVQYSDSSSIAIFSIGNWGLNGNSNTNTIFLGPTSISNLSVFTNNQSRLNFEAENINNFSTNTGFSFEQSSFLHQNNGGATNLTSILDEHLYFNGNKHALHIGNSLNGLDTLIGNYSFSFGYNVGTNGSYSTVFGKNTYGDSTINGATTYDALSSFAFGNNCSVSRISVAIGENATANYYRNVAIGKNVFAGGSSAGISIGNNISTSGATSWSAGHNLTNSGHFSTVIGTNASMNSYLGSFNYGDFSTNDTVFNTTSNQFLVRADSGFIFYTISDLSMGVQLLNGDGSWNVVSDFNKKENIKALNLQSKTDNLQIYTWTYKNQNTIHIGPMAQDFNSVYKVGELKNYINMTDIDGVILEEIKIVNDKSNTKDKSTEIIKLENEIESEKNELEILEERIKILYEKLDN